MGYDCTRKVVGCAEEAALRRMISTASRGFNGTLCCVYSTSNNPKRALRKALILIQVKKVNEPEWYH